MSTSKFWPRLVVLASIMSIILLLLVLCGSVLIFFSANTVFITAERLAKICNETLHIMT